MVCSEYCSLPELSERGLFYQEARRTYARVRTDDRVKDDGHLPGQLLAFCYGLKAARSVGGKCFVIKQWTVVQGDRHLFNKTRRTTIPILNTKRASLLGLRQPIIFFCRRRRPIRSMAVERVPSGDRFGQAMLTGIFTQRQVRGFGVQTR
jgi:hypothetical protein